MLACCWLLPHRLVGGAVSAPVAQDGIGPIPVAGARTVEAPRPQWQGLFLEPVLPPYVEDEAD